MQTCLCSYCPPGTICMRCAEERGYPETMGFRSWSRQEADPRRGLCVVDGCPNVAKRGVFNERCRIHYRIERAMAV